MLTGSSTVFSLAIEAIYDTPSLPDSWVTALDRIGACFNALGVVLMTSNCQSVSAIVSSGLIPMAHDFRSKGLSLYPFVANAKRLTKDSKARVWTDRDLAVRGLQVTQPGYTEFHDRHGLGRFIFAQVADKSGCLTLLKLQGRVGADDYQANDIQIFGELAQHLGRALHFAEQLRESKAITSACSGVLSRLSCGVFLLGPMDQLVFANAAAQRMMGDTLVLREGRLTLCEPPSQSFEALMHSAYRSRKAALNLCNTDPIIVGDSPGWRRLAIFVERVEPTYNVQSGASTLALESVQKLVVAIEMDRVAALDTAVISRLFSLTRSEANVAALIATGLTPREASKQLQITEGTARTILKRVFEKTGVRRQVELALLLARIELDASTVRHQHM